MEKNGYTKVTEIEELNTRQVVAALGFYNNFIRPTAPSITFSRFVKHNVYIGNIDGFVYIGHDHRSDDFISRWCGEITRYIHINHGFWGLTENEEEKVLKSLSHPR